MNFRKVLVTIYCCVGSAMYASERLNVGKDVLTTDPLLQDVDAESVKRLMEKANTIQGFLVLV